MVFVAVFIDWRVQLEFPIYLFILDLLTWVVELDFVVFAIFVVLLLTVLVCAWSHELPLWALEEFWNLKFFVFSQNLYLRGVLLIFWRVQIQYVCFFMI